MSENRKTFKNYPNDSELAVEHFDFELVDEKFLWDTPHDNHTSLIPMHVDPTSLFLHGRPMPSSEMSELTTSSESPTNSDDEGISGNHSSCSSRKASTDSDIMAAAPDWIKSSDHVDDENLLAIDDIDPDLIHSLSDIEPTLADTPAPIKKRGSWLKFVLTLLPVICAVLLIQMPDSTLDILLTTLERHGLFPSLSYTYHPITSQKLTETMCLAPASHSFTYMFVSGCFQDECEVLIVAKDLQGKPKTSGGDTFTAIEIGADENQHNVTLSVYDIQNGSYLVNVLRPGRNMESTIQVSLTNTMQEISNSPLTITWPADKLDTRSKDEFEEESNEMTDLPEQDTATLPDIDAMSAPYEFENDKQGSSELNDNEQSFPSELDYEIQEPYTDFISQQEESAPAIGIQEPTQIVEEVLEQTFDTPEPQGHDWSNSQYPLEEQDTGLLYTATEQLDPEVNQLNTKDTCPIYSINCHIRHSDIGASIKGGYQNVLSVRSYLRSNILRVLGNLGGAFDKYLKPIAGNSVSHVVEARRAVREIIFKGMRSVDKYTKGVGKVVVNWRQQTRKSISIIGDRIRRIFRRV